MSPNKGKKLTDNPKDTMIRVRMDRKTIEKLEHLVNETGLDKSKIIRKGIEIQYENK